MKKKTFFYKFNKDIEKTSASNHNHIVDKEDEEYSKLRIKNLLENEIEIINKIAVAKEKLLPYYEERNKLKIKILNENANLKKYIKHFTENNYFIVNINFGKVLSYNDVSTFIELLGVDLFRISGYDTTLEIIIEKQNDFFIKLRDVIKEESLILKNFLKNQEYGNSNKFLFAIEELNIDSINRDKIFHLSEELKCTRTLVKINKNSFSKEDLKILKEIYILFENENSSVKVDIIEDDNISYLLFFFSNVTKDFFTYISKLFDSIISIEILDGYNNYIQGESVSDINIENIETSNLTNSICIVDSKIHNDNPILNKIVQYGNVYDSNIDSHGTNVGTLASYGKLYNLKLGQPECYIYNIESLQETFIKINEIIKEVKSKGIKVINISQGTSAILNDNQGISEIAKIIDKELVNEDILLLLSGGNISPIKSNYSELALEETNINCPKDSISSISVGAKDESGNTTLYSRKSNVVPSYDIGDVQGRLYRIKDNKSPAFIEYGDNIVFNGDVWYNSRGTSFASPLLGNKAIKILNQYGKISTNTIKALFVNYASQDNLNQRLYPNKDLFHRHIGWGEIDLTALLEDNNSNINIVIEDYISQNEAKRYRIYLPNIENTSTLEIKNAISYNPPISDTYHLKYSKFNVSAKLWSSTYEDIKNNIFGDDSLENPYQKWKEWKDERGTINRVNYFGNTQMWSANSSRSNIYDYKRYKELQNNTEIIIEGHTRNNFKFKQKFSFVMTIDISKLIEPQKYLEDFIKINNEIIIRGIESAEIENNIILKNNAFEIENELTVTVEDLGNF